MKTIKWIFLILVAIILTALMAAPARAQLSDEELMRQSGLFDEYFAWIDEHCPANTDYCRECFYEYDTLGERLACKRGIPIRDLHVAAVLNEIAASRARCYDIKDLCEQVVCLKNCDPDKAHLYSIECTPPAEWIPSVGWTVWEEVRTAGGDDYPDNDPIGSTPYGDSAPGRPSRIQPLAPEPTRLVSHDGGGLVYSNAAPVPEPAPAPTPPPAPAPTYVYVPVPSTPATSAPKGRSLAATLLEAAARGVQKHNRREARRLEYARQRNAYTYRPYGVRQNACEPEYRPYSYRTPEYHTHYDSLMWHQPQPDVNVWLDSLFPPKR